MKGVALIERKECSATEYRRVDKSMRRLVQKEVNKVNVKKFYKLLN